MPREVVVGGRYQLMARLGRGGMGEVYRALDLTTDELVALKRMTTDATQATTARAELRFRREFHTLASLSHPRIVRVYDYGVEDDGPFYTMDLMAGEDLREVIREEGRLEPERACRLLRDVASALALLHARGLVHRDLSPRNVRVIDDRAVLFDFGVLIDAGVAGDVAGTPAYVAPEMLYGQPIDGRTDLYALGVLAYSMLTGETPYPARGLIELDDLWRKPLVRPSEIVEVPETLEELVVELLRLEPLGRPPSAAVLIDKLTAIGNLAPDPELSVQPGYAPTAALVGRDRELDTLQKELDAVVKHGEGRQLYIEAESGAGKSRLLEDLGIRAKLEGARCVTVDCEEAVAENGGSPFAAVTELLRRLFAVAPEDTYDACERDAPLLCRVFPTVARRFPHVDPEAESGEPAEDRMRLQRAVQQVVRRMVKKGPLVILVDDVQRCDEASAAAIAGLAHRTIPGLLLGVARRLGERVRATAAVASLAAIEPRLLLGGLDEDGVEALLRSLFGDAPHLRRLARWMRDATDGSPLFCAELARHLVDEGLIRYDAGSWVLPKDAPLEELPAGLAAAMQRRVAQLSPIARSVGELLAVHGGEMELERCVDLVEGLATDASDGEARAFVAIAELRQQGVLVDLGDRFRFRHDSLREALSTGLDDERRRLLHEHVGETLLAEGRPTQPSRQATIGWHLYHGGRENEGADLLEQAGRALYEAQALSDCIAPLEVALRVREKAGAPRWLRAELSFYLLSAGWVSHRDTGWRYARRALDLLGAECGIETARSLRFLGWLPAFLIGFGGSTLRWLGRLCRGPSPIRTLTSFIVGLSYACALAYAANLKAELRKLMEVAEPFRAFRGQVPFAAYLAAHAMNDIVDGRLTEAANRLTRCVQLVTRRWMNPLTPDEKRLGEAGTRSMRVLVDVNQFENGRLEEDLARMEELDLRFYDLAAQTARIVRHRYRGEEHLARLLEASIEAESLQLGSWSTELQVVLFAHPAYAFCHDVEGLKQCLDSLERYAAEGMEFEARIAVTQGELHRERGEYDAAFAILEPAYAALEESDALMRQFLASALAQTALEAYRWDLAERWAKVGLAIGDADGQRVWLPRLRCLRTLALAEDALGETKSAVRRLDQAIAKAESMDCPPFAGELHEARARVALAAGDRLTYERHRLEAERWLRPTENPGLIAVVERLAELGQGRRGRSIRPERRRPVSESGASTLDAETIAATPSSVSIGPDEETLDAPDALEPMDAPTMASKPSVLVDPMDAPTSASRPSVKSESRPVDRAEETLPSEEREAEG